MKQLSNAFIQALNDDEREYLAYATIQLMNGTILELTNEEIWTGGFRYEESVSDDNSFSALGSAIIGSASLIINNIYDTYSDYDFTNARVILSIGIQNAEDILQIGRYRVDDTNYNGATIQLTLLDNMAEFDRPYSISTLEYPTSVRRIVYDACLNCGMALATVDFPNGDFIVDNRPSDESTTFRDVIAWSAALAGCFAKINIRGNLEFAWFNRVALEAVDVDSPTFHPWDNEELYNANGVHYLYSLNSQNICVDDIIITGVTVHVKSEDDTETDNDILAYSYGESGYVEGDLENDGTGYIILISDNPFITKTNARQVVTSLGTKLLGFRFRKLNITQESDPAIESGDVAIVIDRKLNKYKTLITRNSFGVGSSQTVVCGAETPLRNSGTQSSATTKAYIEARKLFKKSISATDDALNSAIAAAQAAHEAQASADWALDSARSANNSANSALTQLSVVEDVAGTLNWIRENGVFRTTNDTTVVPGTVYFEYVRGDYIPIVTPDPNANPYENGWYVLDVTDSQSEYIMAHLAVTSAGLWVLPLGPLSPHVLKDSADYDLEDSDGNLLVDWSKDPQNADGYKVLLASDGMTIYNNVGTAIAHYGVTTTIGSALLRNVHIDSEAVYIKDGETVLARFDGEGMVINDDEGEIAKFIRGTSYDASGRPIASTPQVNLKKSYANSQQVDESTLDGIELSFSENDTSLNLPVYKARYTRWGVLYNDSPYPVGTVFDGELYQVISPIYVMGGSWVTTHQLILSRGVWLINFGCAFETNATGDRMVVLNNSTTQTVGQNNDIIVKSAASSYTIINGTRVVNVDSASNEVWYLHIGHNATSYSLYVNPYIRAVKLL